MRLRDWIAETLRFLGVGALDSHICQTGVYLFIVQLDSAKNELAYRIRMAVASLVMGL
jgi:hypothetical protein